MFLVVVQETLTWANCIFQGALYCVSLVITSLVSACLLYTRYACKIMTRDRQTFLVLADSENHDKTEHNPGRHLPHMLQEM